ARFFRRFLFLFREGHYSKSASSPCTNGRAQAAAAQGECRRSALMAAPSAAPPTEAQTAEQVRVVCGCGYAACLYFSIACSAEHRAARTS
ncbi:MAG: hypothetical protein ACPIOQ_68420, partial [Promethearchaeia archaeon]